MVRYNKYFKLILVALLFTILFILYHNRFHLSFLYSYTIKHYGKDKYIYTNQFDNLINYRKNYPKYILLSEKPFLLKKNTVPEVLDTQAVVLYFNPFFRKFKDKMYERNLKMLLYKANFLIKNNGFLITMEAIPVQNKTFISEFIADSLKNINRIYSNDAPFFKALGKKSIWLPAKNDSLLQKKIKQINKLIKNNKAAIAYYNDSYFVGRLSKNFLIKYFKDSSFIAITEVEDGFIIYNKKSRHRK